MSSSPPSIREAAGAIDFAASCNSPAWLRHPVLGDPSFDSFVRAPGNPIYRGRPPREWSVNGFLFDDPRDGGLFTYVGRYPKGYVCGPGETRSDCVVLRSTDEGTTWEEMGPVFAGDFAFEGERVGANNAPDVSVVYADGRYHMAYDWAQDEATWASAFKPVRDQDSGVGYAWAERPEGPFYRHPVPIFRNSVHRTTVPGKYLRLYAATLLRRRGDWLLLTLTDSGPHFAWGLYALTAERPEGPWSAPQLVQSLEGDTFHPALMEFFPAFQHETVVYCPATSVALNRNFQCLWQAPLERAHEPAAWALQQHGSLWHAADREEENSGIWGQTFSGQVSRDGKLRAIFPSRDRAGHGTIGLASRPWKTPLRERGFVLNGCAGPSVTLLRRAYRDFSLGVTARVRGTARLLWDWRGVLGPDRHSSDATLHPLVRTGYRALELQAETWRLVTVDGRGVETVVAAGLWTATPSREIQLEVGAAGTVRVKCGGVELWAGQMELMTGQIGWLVERDTHLTVERFAVNGASVRVITSWHFLDAFLATGVLADAWEIRDEVSSRCGQVATSREAGARLKWNFHGTGVRWFAPRGPAQGRVRVKIDGAVRGEFDLHADEVADSCVVFSCEGLADGCHALVVEAITGRLGTAGLDVVGP